MSNIKQVAILLSGNGSHLQNFIDIYDKDPTKKIVLVISNKADSYGLIRAKKANIPTLFVDHKRYPDRLSFDLELISALSKFELDAVILAGFMRILTANFVDHFKGLLVNIHPSLLPKYTGLNTHQRAIDAGDKTAGASVHFVTEELDGGPVIIQTEEKVLLEDTEQTLASRVLIKEHKIYPSAIQWLLDGQLRLEGNYAYFNDEKLPPTGKADSVS